ncbi:hypothetical protein G6M89_14110 [Natronolimnobius sp. AArcel1]|uniref:hypothetical protein n=1 Tax=Natronolimnobius sp. AArcel1 TaxID=1679093 RepID=UPI0013EAA12F|nr:hypothetical protein [Natronolimnobius sp. AArcel1]NGM70127.1 hypothetical protein [Natronolimnobius sp. AArcel1]
MLSRRTRARLDWATNLAVLGLVLLLRRGGLVERSPRVTADANCATANDSCSSQAHAPTHSEPAIETPSLRADWFCIGVASAILYRYLLDRDIAGLRRSRARRWTLIAAIWAGQATLAVDDQHNSHSLGVGSSIGAVCYRLKYGLVSPLPDC